MGLESVTFIDDLIETNPVSSTDEARFSADHLRNIKKALLNTFPNISDAVTANHTQLSYVDITSPLQAQIDSKLAASSYTAADVLAKLITVDGIDSELDADRLDGQQGSYYATAASVAAISVPTKVTATFADPTFGGTGSTTHGQVSAPDVVSGYLKCTATDAGYAVDDIIGITMNTDYTATSYISCWANATNLGYSLGGTTTFAIPHKTTGARTIIDSADWDLYVVGVWY